MSSNVPIRSFVRRDSRMTAAQKLALNEDWPRYKLSSARNAAELAQQFSRHAPTSLEIGCGDGACILELAQACPGENFIAVEVYRPGLGRLLIGAVRADLHNLRVADVDVYDIFSEIEERVFDRVLVFFPDPWPKKRHHKRRLLQAHFFNTLAPCLKRHGRVFIATDCEDYAQSILETIDALPAWVNLSGRLSYAPRPGFRPVTKFEQRALEAGSQIRDIAVALR